MSSGTPWDPNSIVAAASLARLGGGTTGPVLHGTRSTALTYEAFYGLKEKPFSLSSDSRFFYQSRSHAPAFEDLLAGIRRRESLCALTGDIGTGKTTLCRAVLQNLDRKTFSAFVPDPFASREDLLKVLLMDFGVLSVDDLTSGRLKGASRTELSYLLYEFLDTLAPLQAFAVVIIDEAQNLSVPLLEEIRILSDSDGRERQLQVVLVGQLELRQKLKLPEMRQVDQRVSVHCNLEPLGSDGVAGYIAHRLQIAGGSPDRVRFSPDAIESIYRVSGGVPRLINRICDRALSQGYLRRAAEIDQEILEAAVPKAAQPAQAPAAAPRAAAVMRAPMPVTPSVPARPLSLPQDAPCPINEWTDGVDRAIEAAIPAPARPAPAVAPTAVSVTPPSRIVTSVVPVVPSPHDSHDPINDWLTYAEERAGGPAPAPSAAPSPRAAEAVRPAGSMPLATATAAVADRKHGTPVRPEFVPTHMQRTTSRWGRRLGLVALWLMALAGVGVGAASVWSLSTELAAPIPHPALPPERPLTMAPLLYVPQLPDLLLDVPVAGSRNGSGVEAPR